MEDRRHFLKQLSAGLAAAGGCGVLGALLHNRRLVPAPPAPKKVPSFVIDDTDGTLVAVHGSDVQKAIEAALKTLGGIERFVKAGDKVLVKPNCAFDRPPHLGATTSPPVVRAVVQACVAAGAVVRVIDNPINDAEGSFMKSGVGDAVREAGGSVWLPTPSLFALTQIGTQRLTAWEALYVPLAWADKVIGVPTVKSHNLCGASLSMKNWYGLIGGGRNRFHQGIHEVIADLGQFIRPTLNILDGSRLLMRNGPTGGSLSDVAPGNTIVVGTDAVAMDAYGMRLLQQDPGISPYLRLAERLGVGTQTQASLRQFKEITL